LGNYQCSATNRHVSISPQYFNQFLNKGVIMIANNFYRSACFLLCLCAVQLCRAQDASSVAEPGDPTRWYQQDSTPHDYYLTLKKEAEAAYQEAKASCQTLNSAARPACLKDAQAQYKQDLADAKLKEQQQSQ
jgi:hypothetical protein